MDTLVSNWGNPIDLPVAGDWDSDGKDTIGVFRPNPEDGVAWYFTNTSLASGWINAPGIPISFQYYGGPTDKPIAGDWDGLRPQCRDGVDNDQDDWVDWAGGDWGSAAEYDTPEDCPAYPPWEMMTETFENASFPGGRSGRRANLGRLVADLIQPDAERSRNRAAQAVGAQAAAQRTGR